jgi:hypothetical protein
MDFLLNFLLGMIPASGLVIPAPSEALAVTLGTEKLSISLSGSIKIAKAAS